MIAFREFLTRLFRREPVASWHITQANGPASFDHVGRYRDAFRELRKRIPGAQVIHVDREWHVIFYRT